MSQPEKAAGSKTRWTLEVERGVLFPPAVLQLLLPDVASVVKNAMTATATSRQAPHRVVKPQNTATHEKTKDQSTMPATISEPAPQHVPKSQETVKHKKTKNQRSILNPFPCNICKQCYPSRRALNMHLTSHTYECSDCKVIFSNKKQFLKHRCCWCEICDRKFMRMNTLEKHHTEVKCECGGLFKCRNEFRLHKKIHSKVFRCPICKQAFINSLELRNHVENFEFPCEQCDECFPSKLELFEHRLSHPDPPEYFCALCKEEFEYSFMLASHLRSHRAPVKCYSRKPKTVGVKKRMVTYGRTNVEQNEDDDTMDVKIHFEINSANSGIETKRFKENEKQEKPDKETKSDIVNDLDENYAGDIINNGSVLDSIVKEEPSEPDKRFGVVYKRHDLHNDEDASQFGLKVKSEIKEEEIHEVNGFCQLNATHIDKELKEVDEASQILDVKVKCEIGDEVMKTSQEEAVKRKTEFVNISSNIEEEKSGIEFVNVASNNLDENMEQFVQHVIKNKPEK